jgi:hypothetical protein
MVACLLLEASELSFPTKLAPTSAWRACAWTTAQPTSSRRYRMTYPPANLITDGRQARRAEAGDAKRLGDPVALPPLDHGRLQDDRQAEKELRNEALGSSYRTAAAKSSPSLLAGARAAESTRGPGRSGGGSGRGTGACGNDAGPDVRKQLVRTLTPFRQTLLASPAGVGRCRPLILYREGMVTRRATRRRVHDGSCRRRPGPRAAGSVPGRPRSAGRTGSRPPVGARRAPPRRAERRGRCAW